MSGHNPHGRLGQPNPSWNHLQVPSYIPRQPQLAHMSNERPMVRSPLTWHTPTPPEALYSFMAANHKSSLELNPLIPAFVRAPSAPFGSVDLTIPSAARNSSTPSPRSLHSPGLGANISSSPDFSIIKSGSNSSNRTSINLSPTPGVIQSTASIKEKIKETLSNNGEITPGGLFIRDAKQINNDIAKITREPIGLQPMNEPVELVKEAIYHSMKNHSVSISPLRKSPVRATKLCSTVSPKRNKTPPTLNDIPLIKNNHQIHPPSSSPALTNLSCIVPLQSTTTIHENSLPSPSSNNNLTSEDSIDSNTSKKRRKRKPNKTIRMSNDDDDNNCLHKKNNIVEKLTPIITIDKNSLPLKLSLLDKQNYITDNLNNEKNVIDDHTDIVTKHKVDNILANLNKNDKNFEEKSSQNIENNHRIEDNNQVTIINQSLITTNNSSNKNDLLLGNCITKDNNASTTITTKAQVKSNYPIDNIINCNDVDATSPRQRIQRKTETEECETIDKIAAMIASTDSENNQTLPEETKTAKQSCLNQNLENTLNETTTKCDKNDTLNDNTNSFEEVENKLQEMFAGIEDDKPINKQIAGDNFNETEINNKFENNNKNPSTSKGIKRSKSEDVSGGSSGGSGGGPPKKKKKPVKRGNQNSKSKNGKNGKHSSKSHKINLNKEKVNIKIKDETGTGLNETKNYKGPFVQVRMDGSLTVINAPKIEDDPVNKPQNKIKILKPLHNPNSSERNKLRGLHMSTLSMKYDAITTDTSWMCIFCKMGPHKCGLGDLFGPYIITTTSDEFQLSQIDPINDVFKSKRTKQDMIQKYVANLAASKIGVPSTSTSIINYHNISGSATTSQSESPNKKKKKTFELSNTTNQTLQQQKQQQPQLQELQTSPSTSKTTTTDINEIFTGMTKAGDNSFEVWLHEDCAVWSSGVYSIGIRIVGLEAAVWSSTRHKCTICKNYGAMMCCLQRGCTNEVHVPCARNNNWTFSNNDFKIRCEKHNNTT